MLSLSLLPLLAVLPVLASPPPHTLVPKSGCDTSRATVDIPAGQSALLTPTLPVSFMAIGVGIQNYTCSSAGTYTSIGAVAELFDISCLYGNKALFNSIPDIAMAVWNKVHGSKPSELTFPGFPDPFLLGEHYFITNPVTGTGVSPKWDFTSRAFNGNSAAFVVAAKTGGMAAPTGSQDVDWLALNAVTGQGSLASQVFRTDTRLGQPPSSCTAGTPDIQVKYVAKYWLLGGSVKK